MNEWMNYHDKYLERDNQISLRLLFVYINSMLLYLKKQPDPWHIYSVHLLSSKIWDIQLWIYDTRVFLSSEITLNKSQCVLSKTKIPIFLNITSITNNKVKRQI